jgi:hypothetical protein
MPAWTPRDLTNQSFVASQLSPKDRSYALNTVTRELDSAQPRLARQEAELTAAQEASNNRPERGVIRGLLAKAQDQALPQSERDAAAAEAARLQDEIYRSRIVRNIQSFFQHSIVPALQVENLRELASS